ncbi:MAG: BrnT family toxin [Deltaproteobacteria bacterium]|nr:BrnT family toxin [Deltaproteobacteria bacterium]
MNYEWDPEKDKSNIKKHRVRFADAASVFQDNFAITIDDDNQEEQRFVTLGMDAFGRVLVVIYTWRDDNIRIISAKKATPTQRKQYEAKP